MLKRRIRESCSIQTTTMKLAERNIGLDGKRITAIGFGAMGISVAYGKVDSDEERLKVRSNVRPVLECQMLKYGLLDSGYRVCEWL